jgi:hypothetical protein
MKLPRNRPHKNSRKSPVKAYSKSWLDSMYALQSKVETQKSWLDAVKLPDFCLLASDRYVKDPTMPVPGVGGCISSGGGGEDNQTSADGSTSVQLSVSADSGPSSSLSVSMSFSAMFGSDFPSSVCSLEVYFDNNGNLVMNDQTVGGCSGAGSGQTSVYPSVGVNGNCLTLQAYAYSPGTNGQGVTTPTASVSVFFMITSDMSQC